MRLPLPELFQGKNLYPFLLILLIFLSVQSLHAQLDNQEMFEVMMKEGIEKTLENKEIKNLEGFVTTNLETELMGWGNGDTVSLKIQRPQIRLQKVKGKKIARSLQGGYSIVGDSSGLVMEFERTDTIPKKELSRAQKTEYEALRGNYMGAGKKWLFPAVMVATGVGVVLSLFYVRSQ